MLANVSTHSHTITPTVTRVCMHLWLGLFSLRSTPHLLMSTSATPHLMKFIVAFLDSASHIKIPFERSKLVEVRACANNQRERERGRRETEGLREREAKTQTQVQVQARSYSMAFGVLCLCFAPPPPQKKKKKKKKKTGVVQPAARTHAEWDLPDISAHHRSWHVPPRPSSHEVLRRCVTATDTHTHIQTHTSTHAYVCG